ncbi:hypothetical protein BCR33DRAFT_711308 [Rhizoclosmatium globosum]|uniref:Uncharacterized protein n=1 Tax=Rhizoclosmatium globosum TaxID=329046 RepID=A0A1Y2D0S9_9FUNG|nr:hypothetical protein BCR33DRAFT_711308 [Rhizoclosmatium globosum]|eukprot:ORY52889.1 hypothetical protein BCR33DRAFT_711308 [Rhizoclosmatium globosum]
MRRTKSHKRTPSASSLHQSSISGTLPVSHSRSSSTSHQSIDISIASSCTTSKSKEILHNLTENFKRVLNIKKSNGHSRSSSSSSVVNNGISGNASGMAASTLVPSGKMKAAFGRLFKSKDGQTAAQRQQAELDKIYAAASTHKSSIDRRVDTLYESQSTLQSISLESIPDAELENEEEYDGIPANLSLEIRTSFEKPPLPSSTSSSPAKRDSAATARNSAAESTLMTPSKRISARKLQQQRLSSPSKTKVGVDLPHPLYYDASDFHLSSTRPSTIARVLGDSRVVSIETSISSRSIPRTRSYTHIEKGSTSDASSPPKSTFKPNPKMRYMSGSTPYSWWWLSGLSGDSILPDSFGFIEPTFHERTQFNTEGKRPGFKRLVLAPIKKLIGVETGYDENEIGANALNPVGVVDMSPTSPKGANVTVPRRKSQVLVLKSRIQWMMCSERIALSLSRKSSMKRPSLPVSPARAFSESVSYDGTDPEPVNASIQMETYSDSHRHPSKKVFWNAKTLDLGESKGSWQDSDLPDNLAREQQLIDIPGMSRIRQSIRSSVTILSREESSALSLNRAQDKSLDRHSRSSVELEELDAAIAKCAAQSGSDNPFVKALMEQRARVADEMDPYIS